MKVYVVYALAVHRYGIDGFVSGGLYLSESEASHKAEELERTLNREDAKSLWQGQYSEEWIELPSLGG